MMKSKSFLFSIFCVSMLLAFGLIACHKDDKAIDPPAITSFTPAEASPGSTVEISGRNFTKERSAVAVKFNGVEAVVSATDLSVISVIVPEEAKTGKITVTIGNHTATSATDFKVNPASPLITAMQPSKGVENTEVMITGARFENTSEVFFGEVKATDVTFQSKTSLKVKVPAGGLTGKIKVKSGDLVGLSNTDFVVAPRITGVSVLAGNEGEEITITGANFSADKASNIIAFGTGNALVGEIVSAGISELKVKAPVAGTDGKISVTIEGMTASSADDFVYKPMIRSFTPDHGERNTTVSLTVARINTEDVQVSINDIVVTSFIEKTSTLLKFNVPDHNSVTGGKIKVVSKSNSAETATPFVVTNVWFVAPLQSDRKYDMHLLVIGDKLYQGNGAVSAGVNNSWSVLDLKTGARESLPDFPVIGPHKTVAFVIGTDIYCGGGEYNVSGRWELNRKFYKLNTLTKEWTEIAIYPGSETISMSAFTLAGEGYVGLGRRSGAVTADFYRYKPSATGPGTWEPIKAFGNDAASEDNKRYNAMVLCDGNRVFVGGGVNGSDRTTYYEYFRGSNNWVATASFSNITQGTGIALNNRFFAIDQNTCWEYLAERNVWSKVKDLPAPTIYFPSGFAYDGALYQAGGYEFSGSINTVSVIKKLVLNY